MATNPRLEQLKTALINADKAGATEDARRLAEAIRQEQVAQQALQADEFNRQQGFQLQPKTQTEIDRAQGRAVKQAERFWEDRQPGMLDRAGSLLGIGGAAASGSIEAAPSGIAAGAQLGTGAYLGESRDLAQGVLSTDPQTVEGLTRRIEAISSPFSNLVGLFTPEQAPEQLKQAGQANLQETLAIRQKNAEELAKLKQAYIAEGGGEFAADLAQGVGGSLTSVAPLAGAAIVGGATRNPTAALIAQRALAILPATQAYADNYAEYKSQYPNASEEDAQRYAMSMAGIEFGVESMLPTGAGALSGTGLRQAAGAVAGRTAQEGLTEGATEITSQVAQREMAPELAPKTPGEALYNVGLSAAAGSVLGGAINAAGVQAERVGLTRAQRVEQQRLAELAAADETGKVAEGVAVVQALEQGAAPEVTPDVAPEVPSPPRQTIPFPDLMQRLDERVQELTNLSSDGYLSRSQMKELEREEVELRAVLREQEQQERTGALPADPSRVLTPEEKTIATNRLQEINLQREKGRAAKGYATELKNIQERLGKIDNDNELASYASRLLGIEDAQVQRQATPEVPVSPVEPQAAQSATTVPEQPQTAAPVAARATPVEVTGPIVREDVIDPNTGQTTGEQTVQPGVVVGDTRRQELETFFSTPREEPLSSTDLLRAEESAEALAPESGEAPLVIPVEQRKPSRFEQQLAQVSNARDAVNVIRSYAKPGSPFARVLDALDSSPFLDNVAVKVFQPEDNLPAGLQGKNVRGVMQSFMNGRMEVSLKGSGFVRSGTTTPEIALHEIVHVASVDLINGVNEKRITDPRAVASVKRVDLLRQELKKSLDDGTLRSQLTGEEKSALDYATKNSKEFVSQALSSGAVQTGLKKEGLWTRFVSAIRGLFGANRQDTPLFEKIMDASLSVVQEQTRLAPQVREGRRQAEQEFLATTRAQRMEANQADIPDAQKTTVNEARQQAIGSPTRLRPMPRSDLGRRIDRVGRFLHDWLSSNKRGTDETTEAFSKAQGAIQRAHAELQPIGLKLDRLLSGNSRRRSNAKSELATKYLSTNNAQEKADIAKQINFPDLVNTLDKARGVMDRVSTEVGREIVKAYQGRTMPEGVAQLLQTIKKNLGQYTARVYLADIESGYASRLWESYKKGDAAAKEQLQPLVDKVDGMLNTLDSWLQGAKEEAALLSDKRVDFDPADTVLGKEIRNRYSNFLGNPGNKSLKELFKELEDFSASVEKSDLAKERDRAVQKLIGVFDDAAQGDALVQYARAMRSDDKATLRRQNVPPYLRKAWGEIVDPILLVNVTTARAAAAMANLRSSNYLVDNAPNLFSTREDPDTNKMARIPNNPSVYGKMAGMYTIPAVHDAVVAQTAMLGAQGVGNDVTGWLSSGFQTALGAARTVTRWTKLTQIVTNVFNGTILNSLNLVYMPLINGNISPARLKEAFLATQSLVATAYRTGDPHPRAVELLEQGVIDPVQLQTDEEVRSRTREARLIEQGAGATRTAGRQFLTAGFTNPLNTLKEVVNFFELLPKAWNYYNAKDEFKAAFPDLSEAEIRNLAAEQTNQMNPTYARTRQVVQATETTMLSYTANYMEQIATNTAMAIKVGATQATNGIRTGNKQLAYMGIKKLMGVSGAMGASYMLPSLVASALGLVEDDEDQIIADNLPFVDRGMQPVIIGVDGDRVVFMDAGRANPGDTVHAPLRAFISAIANIENGNTEEASRDLEGGVNNLKGQFFGGSMLGTIALSMLQGRRTGQQLERGAPEVYSWIAENAPAPALSTNLANAAYSALVPAQAKGVAEARTRRGKQGDEFEWNTREILTALRAPVRDVSMIDSVAFSARSVKDARREPTSNLKVVALSPGEISDERLTELVDNLIEAQQSPYEDMLRSLEGIRALGRKQNLPAAEVDKMLREGLKAGGIAGRDMDAIIRGEPFQPRPLDDSFLKDDIEAQVRRQDVRQEKVRLQAMYDQRVARIKDIMDERIKNYNQ